jgi:valyl-tRNA synthetase
LYESSLQSLQEELKHSEEQNEKSKQNIQQFVQSIDEQRSVISEFEIKLQDSQTRSTELENEKQRIQNDFDEYFQRTHHLEELQQKSIQVRKTKKEYVIYIFFLFIRMDQLMVDFKYSLPQKVDTDFYYYFLSLIYRSKYRK